MIYINFFSTDIKENHTVKTILDQFYQKLSSQPLGRSMINVKGEGIVRYLRRLQIFLCQDNFLKIPHQTKESGSLIKKLSNIFKKGNVINLKCLNFYCFGL
jgi:hypothetical protein